MNCHPTLCGMLVEVEDGQLLRVMGDKDNPDSQGFLCVRGQASREIIGNSARLLHPLMRSPRSGAWRQVSWDDALDHIAERMRAAGRESVGVWSGHGFFATNYGTRINSHLLRRFANLYGCQWWNPTMICWGLGAFGLGITGVLETNTKEDMGQHANFVLLWGANLASQPNTGRHLAAAKHRGARVVAIDVRETEATSHADESLLIRPGTDAALALGLMHVIIGEQLHDPGFVQQHTVGFDELAAHVKEYSPAWAASVTGIPAERIVALARAYAAAKPAMIVVGGSSMHKGPNGWQAARAIGCLPALTGNLGIEGGGFGPRHGSSTHGQGLASIVALERRPAGSVHREPDVEHPRRPRRRARARPAPLRDGHDLLVRRRRPAGRGAVAPGSRGELRAVHERHGAAVRRRRAAEHVLAGGAGVQEHQHASLPDAQGARSARARRAPARGCSESWRAASISRTSTRGPPRRASSTRCSTIPRRATRRWTRCARRAACGRSRSPTWPTRSARSTRRRARWSSSPSARGRSGLPALPVWEAPSASPYPLTFQQGRTLAHFHSFFDHGRALPSLAKAEAEPNLWISPTDAAARSLADGAPIRIYNERGEFGARAHVTARIPPGTVWMHDGWEGINRLTSGRAVLPDEAVDLFHFSAGQSAFDARVEVAPA